MVVQAVIVLVLVMAVMSVIVVVLVMAAMAVVVAVVAMAGQALRSDGIAVRCRADPRERYTAAHSQDATQTVLVQTIGLAAPAHRSLRSSDRRVATRRGPDSLLHSCPGDHRTPGHWIATYSKCHRTHCVAFRENSDIRAGAGWLERKESPVLAE